MSDGSPINFEHLEPVPLKYGHLGMICGFAFFHILNKLVTKYGTPKAAQREAWKWTSLFISWIHAVIAGIWATSWYAYLYYLTH